MKPSWHFWSCLLILLFLFTFSNNYGKKHQTNLARRAAQDAKENTTLQAQLYAQQAAARNAQPKKQFIKIGSPGYQITKVKDPITGKQGLLFQIHYPEIKQDVKPHHRFMSSFEQRVEQVDSSYQYLVVRSVIYFSIRLTLLYSQVNIFLLPLFVFFFFQIAAEP